MLIYATISRKDNLILVMVSQNKNLETETKCKESKIKTHRSIKNL